jgi:hypothetical protein
VPSYTVGYIDVYRNGVRLVSTDFTATTGTTVVLVNACTSGDSVVTESFLVSSVLNAIPATAGAISLTSATYLSGQLPVANGGTGLNTVPHTMTVYTSGSGTYTTPTNCKAIYIQMVGGGGNGGSGASGAGGGGGAGGYLEVVINSPSASYTYAVGAAGGNTTFNSTTYSANGGSVGTAGSVAANGGSGGTATGGSLNITGATGGYGWGGAPYYNGGYGAASFFGGGGMNSGTNNGNASAGVVYGSGGGGGVGGGAAGAGVGGLIIITEFYV